MRLNKLLLLVFSVAFVLCLYLIHWQSPAMRPEMPWATLQFYETHGQYQILESMNHTFDINYIKNMDSDSVNPYFPGIAIKQQSCNAWLHIVQTDSKLQPEFRHFVDSVSKDNVLYSSLYPFYTKGNFFTDQPQWGYTFFYKPLSYWIGHAWAIQLDEHNKTIKCIGGISWGYRLFCCSFKPSMILPEPLYKEDWMMDWKVFKKALPDYQDITK